MHFVLGIKDLMSVATVRLAVTLYYACEPRWNVLPKAAAWCAVFAASFLAADVIAPSGASVATAAFCSSIVRVLRWLECYIVALFAITALADVVYRWGVGFAGTCVVSVIILLPFLALSTPILLQCGVVWCECHKPRCPLCALKRTKN